MCTELGLNMCTRTGIKHVYLGVQGACPRQAVTGTGGMARAVGAGLKLVVCLRRTYEFPANAAHALSQNTTVSLRKFIS